MPTRAYLGTDLPLDERMVQPAQQQAPPPFPPPADMPPPTTLPGRMPGREPRTQPLDPHSAAEMDQQLIADAAKRYMGVDSESLDDAQYDQLLNDLSTGYPDDAALQAAIQAIRAGIAQLPAGDESMTFNQNPPR